MEAEYYRVCYVFVRDPAHHVHAESEGAENKIAALFSRKRRRDAMYYTRCIILHAYSVHVRGTRVCKQNARFACLPACLPACRFSFLSLFPFLFFRTRRNRNLARGRSFLNEDQQVAGPSGGARGGKGGRAQISVCTSAWRIARLGLRAKVGGYALAVRAEGEDSRQPSERLDEGRGGRVSVAADSRHWRSVG